MENNDKLKEKVKFKIAISEIKKENDIDMKKTKQFINYKTGLVACICLILTAGVVFAKDIESFIKEKFWDGNGIQTAINNGYVGNAEDESLVQNVKVIENSELIDTIDVNCKVGEFLMTDSSINIELDFEFDKKINDYIDLGKIKNGYIDYENSHNIELFDIFITDEENNVLYFSNNDDTKLKEYCINNNSNFNSSQNLESYSSIGFNEIYHNEDTIYVHALLKVYSNVVFPRSKELNIFFNKIRFIPKETSIEGREIFLEGNWKYHLDIPESIYNRNSIQYQAVEYENTDFEVYEATLTETRFEVGLKIHNIEKPTLGLPEEIRQKNVELGLDENYEPYFTSSEEEFLKIYGEKKYLELWEDYIYGLFPINPLGFPLFLSWRPNTSGCYMINSNGDRFEWDGKTSGYRSSEYEENSSTYNFYGYYEMTKFDATDEITLVIDFKGTPVNIKLKKIN